MTLELNWGRTNQMGTLGYTHTHTRIHTNTETESGTRAVPNSWVAVVSSSNNLFSASCHFASGHSNKAFTDSSVTSGAVYSRICGLKYAAP